MDLDDAKGSESTIDFTAPTLDLGDSNQNGDVDAKAKPKRKRQGTPRPFPVFTLEKRLQSLLPLRKRMRAIHGLQRRLRERSAYPSDPVLSTISIGLRLSTD